MFTIIKASGAELLPKRFTSFCELIREEQKTGKKIILVFGGGVQIDAKYEAAFSEPRPKNNGMGITTDSVLNNAVTIAYAELCTLLKTQFPEVAIISHHNILGEKKSEFGWVITPKTITLQNSDFQAIGFLGKDENNNDCNVNADDITELLCQQQPVEKVIFLTKSGGIYDNNHKIIDFLSQKDIQKLIQNQYKNANVTDGMLKKCQVLANILQTVPHITIRTSKNKKSQTICENIPAVLPVYASKKIPFAYGKGSYLYTASGEKYLDMMSGVAVNILGHSNDEWIGDVHDQLQKCTHISNYYISEPQQQLAEKLVEISFADQVFFSNSGTEANEAALKFAKKYGKTISEEKTEIIAFVHGFHGRSMGSLSVTEKEIYRKPFAPLIPNIIFCEYNDIEAFKNCISHKTAAVIVEPIQGEGGIYAASSEFLQTIREECNKNKSVLIFDEVQCGLGRTGNLFAYQSFGIEADIMTLAKPLAGGIPMGATLVTGKIGRILQKGDHGSTFGGNPLACASALHILKRLEEKDFLPSVQQKSAYLLAGLQKIQSPHIISIRSFGMMIGIECNGAVQPFIDRAYDQKLLIISAGENVIRLLPPLTISQEEIDEACEILTQVIGNI